MLVRKAKSTDFEKVLKIYDEGYQEVKESSNFGDYFRLIRPNAKRKNLWIKSQTKMLKDGDSIFYVAEENKKIVGFCYVIKKDIPDSEMSHVGVLAIRVAKDWRNKKIGTKLMEHTVRNAKGTFEILEVFPFAINDVSKDLYKKFGFKTWGTAPGYVKRGKIYLDMEYMYLKL